MKTLINRRMFMEKEFQFKSVVIKTYGSVKLTVGDDFVITDNMYIEDDVLIITSETSGVSIKLPKSEFDCVELVSEASYIECSNIAAKRFFAKAFSKIKLENIIANDIECESEASSINIKESNIQAGDLLAYGKISVKLLDFKKIEIESQTSSVQFFSQSDELVYSDCNSDAGKIKASNLFLGTRKANKKISVQAYGNISLLQMNNKIN